jgi:hypothetical protein
VILDDLDRPVVVAVIAVGVVEAAVDEVVDVVAVGHGLVPAPGAVDVLGVVDGGDARLDGVAPGGVARADGQDVLVDLAVGDVVEVPVVEVIDVAVVLDGGVPAAGAVLVGVVLVLVLVAVVVVGHGGCS